MEPDQSRVIRVFASSTFRDMQRERDHLIAFTFPALRRLCESRAVTWVEVDLRWGVTDEAVSEGKVLPACLAEIHRCRPYFIGLLGERYGWVPDTVPAELVENEPWLSEMGAAGKSVTELEILHGVLNNPAMENHAFFYLRDPEAVNDPALSDDERWDMVEHDVPADVRQYGEAEAARRTQERKGKLAALKETIRGSGFPVREPYSDAKSLGAVVPADFTALIDRLYPDDAIPDPLDREAMDHAAYARSRCGVYIGRPDDFARLDRHAQAAGNSALVVLGESGSGKSALLANWASRYRQAHPDTLMLEHYIGATPASADWASMLRRLMGEFKRRFDMPEEIPDTPDALRAAFPNWLHMVSARIASQADSQPPWRLMLVLDALNQLEDRDGAPDLTWLPPAMPDNVRLVVSTLPGWAHDEIRRRGWPVMEVALLSEAARGQLIVDYLKQFAKELDQARRGRIAAAPQAANPLYLRVLLDELRVFGQHERLDERIDHSLQAQTPYELYEKVIVRWEESYEGDTDLVGDTFLLLWAARRGLGETELLDALGDGEHPLPRAEWSPLFLAMADSLVSCGGLLTFAHDFLRTAARDAYAPGEDGQRRAHGRLAVYFASQPAGPRRTDELPWQLVQAWEWRRLYDLLAERPFFMAAWSANQFDVKAYWASIEANSPLRMVEAYQAQVERPEDEADKSFIWLLGALLGDTGHPEEALRIRQALVEHFKDSGDQGNLQACLGNQANILYSRGDLDGAMALHKEEERICRQSGKLDGLQACLGNQASILGRNGQARDALPLAEEAYHLANEHGYATLAGQFASLLEALRNAVQGR